MKITDEQALDAGNKFYSAYLSGGNFRESLIAGSRAAYEVIRPIVLAEALAEPQGEETNRAWNQSKEAWNQSKGEPYAAMRILFANRLQRLTAKEPTLVERVEAILIRRGIGACPTDTAQEIAQLLEDRGGK